MESECKAVAMCPPRYFTVEYKINEWMGGTVDRIRAQDQWDRLKSSIQKCGIEVKEIEPVEGLLDMVFCCNAGIVNGDRVYLSKFRHPQRTGEEKHYKNWFLHNGYEVFESQEFFEGGGDAVISRSDSKLWAGYGQRSVKKAYDEIGQIGKLRTIFCEMVHPKFYHLDTCFALLNSKTALWYPSAFSEDTQVLIKSEIPNLIAVSEKDAAKFVCNSINFGNVVIAPPGCHAAKKEMEKRGFHVVEVDLSEFMKSGGACQCLVLKL